MPSDAEIAKQRQMIQLGHAAYFTVITGSQRM
jgi:hypothetical protein